MMSEKIKMSLCWLRRDLRLEDHCALSEALACSEKVAVVFVFDKTILNKLEKNDRRVTFIHKSLQEVNKKLTKYGASLIVRFGDPKIEIPFVVNKLKAKALFYNRDYEPEAIKRDAFIKSKLERLMVKVFDFKDQVIFEGNDLLNKEGNPYKVFTPYKKSWLDKVTPHDIAEHKLKYKNLLPSKDMPANIGINWTLKNLGFSEQESLIKTGTTEAKKQWNKFLKKINCYDLDRDFPYKQATSLLSVHLRFGTISIRKLVREVLKLKSQGAKTWLSEIIWREFYMMILYHFPHVAQESFKKEYAKIAWPGRWEHFEAWKKGMTGYPIIDAAMRHFNQTGLMHNRLRMVAASFLVKDLLIDWKDGEKYFSKHLLDYDLAANNGGWQWCASTGTDAQPYFRIFNPYNQSKKFDPEALFISQHCPELKNLPTKYIHQPHLMSEEEQEKYGCRLGVDYPLPIVDHSEQREIAIAVYGSTALTMSR